MNENFKCVKCAGAMIEGFIFDRGEGNHKQQQIWVEGAAEESFWSGIKTSGRATFIVQAMRCGKCGFLEFYTSNRIDLDNGFLGLFDG